MEITKENLQKFIKDEYEENNSSDEGIDGYNCCLEKLEEVFVLGENSE